MEYSNIPKTIGRKENNPTPHLRIIGLYVHNMKMNNKTYDIIKWIAQIVLPALGTLYFALAGIWGFPYGEQIVGTITAIDTFLGAILHYSNSKYINEVESE